MFELSNVYFTFEILLAEIIFLFASPKRKYFALRYAFAFIACLGISYLFPMPPEFKYNAFYTLLRFLSLFALTVGGMALCFKSPLMPLFSACVSGYAAQHILYHVCVLIGKSELFRGFRIDGFLSRSNLLELVFMVPLYAILLLSFGFYAAKNKSFSKSDVRYFVISVFLVFLCIGYSRMATALGERNLTMISVYAITSCLLALFLQIFLKRMGELQRDNRTLEVLFAESKKQYQISKENMQMVNIKYHDLMKRVDSFGDRLTKEEIQSVRDVLHDYSSIPHTGSEALDVLLMQIRNRCETLGVELNYFGDGGELSFLAPTDVYSLFGNALDNAVEAVGRVNDPAKRVIEVVLERKGDIVNVSITNYFEGELEMNEGLPLTSKEQEPGYHGFGMSSIRMIVKKYGGSMSVSAENHIFTLGFYLVNAGTNS